MAEAMVFWLQDPEPAKWHGRSPFVRQPAYSIAQDRIRELEAAILVHRQQEPNCRCGFEIVLPSNPPRSDAVTSGGAIDGN